MMHYNKKKIHVKFFFFFTAEVLSKKYIYICIYIHEINKKK